jgi:preprotein translocase subunit SecA
MLDTLKHDVIGVVSRVQIRAEEDVQAVERQRQQREAEFEFKHEEFTGLSGEDEQGQEPQAATAAQPFVRPGRKVGRNEPCPCGSGKKYKQCHGRIQ